MKARFLQLYPLGTTVYFINTGIVGNVNSPGSGLFNRIALLIGPLTWYIILGCIVLVRSRAQTAHRSFQPTSLK
jgi:hypothetical protein